MKTSLKVITLLISVLCLAHSQAANAQAITLISLGDSLTIGDGDDTGQGGFPSRVLAMLQNNYPGSTLSNQAISGLTSDDLINIELPPTVSALNAAPVGNRKIAFVWIGSNDLFGLYNDTCDKYYPGNYSGCEADDISRYRRNLETILAGLKAAGAEPYIALLDDQSKRKVMADANLRLQVYSNISTEEVSRMSAQVVRYNEVIRDLAAARGATTVDFYTGSLFSDSAMLSSDGNHPNGAGYDVIAQRWYAQVTGGTVITPPASNPLPDIFANQKNNPITVTLNSPLEISLALNPGGFTGSAADWWMVAVSPSGVLQNYQHPNQWSIATLDNLTPAYQGTVFQLPQLALATFTPTEAGVYQLYFGVDMRQNGRLDLDVLFYDIIEIAVVN